MDTIETLPTVEDTPLVPTTEEIEGFAEANQLVEVVGFVQDQPEEEAVDATEVAPVAAF